jgi:hypothetical protein
MQARMAIREITLADLEWQLLLDQRDPRSEKRQSETGLETTPPPHDLRDLTSCSRHAHL